MNYKKLLATAVFTLGAWMSVGTAQAQTNYDFTFTVTGRATTGTATSTGADPSLPFSSISNLDAGVPPNTYTILPFNGVYGYANPSVGGINSAYVQFILDGYQSYGIYENIYGTNTLGLLTGGTGYVRVYTSLALAQANNPADSFSSVPIDSFSITLSSPVAPEMNASLIPQVGLLLGCLFFLMGRKREVVEPILAA